MQQTTLPNFALVVRTVTSWQTLKFFACKQTWRFRKRMEFLTRDAMHKSGLCRRAVSTSVVCLSVRLSRSCILSKQVNKFPNKPCILSALNKQRHGTRCWKVWLIVVKIWRPNTQLFKNIFWPNMVLSVKIYPGSCYPNFIAFRLNI